MKRYRITYHCKVCGKIDGYAFTSDSTLARKMDTCRPCRDCRKNENQCDVEKQIKPENRGEASRVRDYKNVYAATRNHRAAIRAYCAGNVWATENAKAVGNW